MPIISYPQPPQKGSPSSVTLDKAELLAVSVVSQDPYFSDQNNWNKIIVFMRSANSNQNIQYIFDASESQPTAQFLATEKARDDFELVKLVINDFDGGSLTLNRNVLNEQEFDFSFALEEFFTFAISEDDTLRKIDAQGNIVWTAQAGNGAIFTRVATDNLGNSYTSEGDSFSSALKTGNIRKYDSNGNQVGIATGPQESITSLAVDDAGLVYAGFADNTVRKLDPSDNSSVWTFSNMNGQANDLALDQNGNLYAATNNSSVIKIDPSGNKVWENFQSFDVKEVIVDKDDFVYIGQSFGRLNKLDPTTGNSLLIYNDFSGSGSVIGLSIDNAGNLYAAHSSETVRKLDPSGQEVWRFEDFSNFVVRDIDIDQNGFVYAASNDASVRVLDPNGQQVSSFEFGDNKRVRDVAVEPGRIGAGFWNN